MTEAQLTLSLAPEVNLADADVATICDRLAKWQQLFSPGRAAYALAGYEDLFLQSPDGLLVYDNYAEEDTHWLGFERYRQVWEREINKNFPGFVMYRIEVDRIEVSADLAWTAATWFGRVRTATGAAWPAQHATHGWRRVDGQWRIVHEHLTSGVKRGGREPSQEQEVPVHDSGTVRRHTRLRSGA